MSRDSTKKPSFSEAATVNSRADLTAARTSSLKPTRRVFTLRSPAAYFQLSKSTRQGAERTLITSRGWLASTAVNPAVAPATACFQEDFSEEAFAMPPSRPCGLYQTDLCVHGFTGHVVGYLHRCVPIPHAPDVRVVSADCSSIAYHEGSSNDPPVLSKHQFAPGWLYLQTL
eukprot:1150326-Prorocentrum_minimum.AAC.2